MEPKEGLGKEAITHFDTDQDSWARKTSKCFLIERDYYDA